MAQWLDLERVTDDRVVAGLNPSVAASKLWKYPLYTLPVSFGGHTKTVVGTFYLVSMPGEVKYPTRGGKCVTCRGLHYGTWSIMSTRR